MNSEIYLKQLAKQIQNREVRCEIMKEYKAHIIDCKEAFMVMGMTEAEAEEKAVEQMGDPEEAATQINRVYPRSKLFFYSVLADTFSMTLVFFFAIYRIWSLFWNTPIITDNMIQIFLMVILIICAGFSMIYGSVYCKSYLKGEEKTKIGTKMGFCFCIQAVLLAAIICVSGF